MASARAAEAVRHEVRPEDSASVVGSQLGSHASWSLLPEEQSNVAAQPAQDQFAQDTPGAGRSEPAQADQDEPVPPADPTLMFGGQGQGRARRVSQAASAPAAQAAKNLLGSAQKQAERLARQKAQAKRKGQRQIRWGQMPGLNAQNFQLPHFIQQIGAGKAEQSMLVMDSRDRRIQSPFQG